MIHFRQLRARCLSVLACLVAVAGAELRADAQNPGFRLQGALTTPAGVPVAGLTTITVRLYRTPTGGVATYAETFTTMMTAGNLDLIVGAGGGTPTGDISAALAPEPSTGRVDAFVALQIEPDTDELSPRRRVTGGLWSMWATTALSARDAQSLGGQPAASYVTAATLAAYPTTTQVTTTLAAYPTTTQLTTTLQGYAQLNPDAAQTFAGQTTFSPTAAVAFQAATGQAPFAVASTTVVNNLNADSVDGVSSESLARLDVDNIFTRAQLFDGEARFEGATTFAPSVGQPPFAVTSSVVVQNLNAELLDGLSSAAFARVGADNQFTGLNTFNGQSTFVGNAGFQGNVALPGTTSFNAAQGTAPFAVTSTTQIDGLNAALLNGQTAAQIIAAAGGGGGSCATCNNATALGGVPAASYARLDQASTITATQTFSSAPAFSSASGAPFTVTSQAVVTNLNADQLDGRDATFFQNASNLTAGAVSSARGGTGGDTSGAGNGAILRANGSGAWLALAPGVEGQVLKIQSGVPAWGTDSTGAGGGGGTVTSVTAGVGLTGGTITSSGTLAIDAAVVPRLASDNTYTGTQSIQTGAAGSVGLAVQGAISQSAALQEWRNSSGTPIASVSAAGAMSAASFSGSGAGVTNLNASNVTTGTLPDARLSSNVARLDQAQLFTGAHTFGVGNLLIASGASATTLASSATTGRTATLPDVSGTVVTTGNLSAITSTGTIGTGTWQGTPIGAQFGGTGLNTASTPRGSVLFTSAAGTWSTLPAGSDGQVLKLAGGVPSWGTDNTGAGGGGTVTSVGTGLGLIGGPITGSGTVSIDTAVVPRLTAANAFTAGQSIQGAGIDPALVVRSIGGHSGPLQEWRDASNAPMATMSQGGVLSLLSVLAPIGTVSAQTLSGAGSGITNLNASNVASGTLASARGGTGGDTSGASNGALLRANGAGAWSALAPGTNGQVLTVAGGVPTWSALSASGVTSLTAGSGISMSPGSPITTTGTISLASNVPRTDAVNAFTTRQTIATGGSANVGLTITGVSGQTSPLQDWRSNVGSVATLNASGALSLGSVSATGTVSAGTFSGSGASLTSLDASNLSSGTVADIRLSSNVARLDATQTFSGAVTLSNAANSLRGVGTNITALNATNLASGVLPSGRLSGSYTSAITMSNLTGAGTFNGTLSGTFSGSGSFSGNHSGDGTQLTTALLGRRRVRQGFGCILRSPTTLDCETSQGTQTCSFSTNDCGRLSAGPCRDNCIDEIDGVQYAFAPIRVPGPGSLTVAQTVRAIVCKATAVPAVIDMELRIGEVPFAAGQAVYSVAVDQSGAIVIPQPTLLGEAQVNVPVDQNLILFMRNRSTTGLCFLLQQTSFNVRFVGGQIQGLGDE